MILWDEGDSTDSVRVYTEDPSVLVTSDRANLQVLKEIPEASKPGVYVLMGEQKRYVGQASGSVWSRINSHDKNKDWWTRVLFFSRIDGHLDKSQLDYLEAKLIRQFSSSGFDMENKDSGNLSYIGPYQRGQAESLLSTVESILLKDVGLDIFKKKPVSRAIIPKPAPVIVVDGSSDTDNQTFDAYLSSKPSIIVRSELFGTIEGKSGRRIHQSYVQKAWKNHSELLIEKMYGPNLILRTDAIDTERKNLFFYIDDTYSLYVNHSRAGTEGRIMRISEMLDDSVSFEVAE